MFIRITMQLYTSFFVYFAKPGNIMTDAHLSHTIFCLFLLSESTGTGFVTVSCFSAIFTIFVKQALGNRRIHHFFPMYKVHRGRDGVVVIFLTINHNTSIRQNAPFTVLFSIFCLKFEIVSNIVRMHPLLSLFSFFFSQQFQIVSNTARMHFFTVLVFKVFFVVPNRFK